MPAADPVDNMAPRFAIEIGGGELGPDLSRFVRSVEYESADGIADVAKLKLANPDFAFSESKLFQPGNGMNIHMGYGPSLEFIGRVEIARLRCNFPKDAMPTAEIIGYSRDHALMDNSPEKGSDRAFYQASSKEIIEQVAGRYPFMTAEVDNFLYTGAVTQKAGMSDYDFVKGLANIAGFLFWIDANEAGFWRLHFVNPDGKIGKSPLQEERYTFKYGSGEASTLLEFQPEYAVRGARTKIKVAIRDPVRGEDWVEIVEEEESAPDIKSPGATPYDELPSIYLGEPIPSGATIKLFFGEFSLEIVPNKHFVNPRDVRIWAERWFQRRRQNFLIGNGTLVGVETLRARQVHALSGLGTAFDGDYYFSRVRHVMASGSGYFVDFSARKHQR